MCRGTLSGFTGTACGVLHVVEAEQWPLAKVALHGASLNSNLRFALHSCWAFGNRYPAQEDTAPTPLSHLRLTTRRGKYEGPEAERLAALKWAAMLGAAYVDVELEAAKFFFGGAGAAHPSLYADIVCLCAEAKLSSQLSGRTMVCMPSHWTVTVNKVHT